MMLRALLLPAALLLIPKGCADHDTAPAAREAQVEPAAPEAAVAPALDGGGLAAAPADANAPAARVEDTPERRAFYAEVERQWMRRLRREPEMRREIDTYRRNLTRGSVPWSPPPWPTGFATGHEPQVAEFVWSGCVGPDNVRETFLAGLPWHRNGVDRVCCYSTSPTRRQRVCFDTSGDTPRHVSTENVAP